MSALPEPCARAQGNPARPHPTVGDPLPGVLLPSKYSPYFDALDGLWNQGEGFPHSTEQGGVLSLAPGVPLRSEVFTSSNWQLLTDPLGHTTWQYLGYLADQQVAPGSDPADAAFVLRVPASWALGSSPPGGKPVVLVISIPPTIVVDRPAGNADAWIYPGIGSGGGPGLKGAGWPTPHKLAYRSEAQNYWVVGAHIEPRVFSRPLLFFLQRIVELRHAAHLLLDEAFNNSSPPASWDFDAVVVAGTSGGGLVAQMAALLRPDIFHGAINWSFPGSLPRGIMDHECYDFCASLLGHGGTHGYSSQDLLDWNFALHQRGTDFAHTSYPACFQANAANQGHLIQRPMYFLVADEDIVVHPENWIPLFDSATPAGTYRPWGSVQVPGGDATTKLSWSVFPKRGHEGLEGLTYPHPETGNPMGSAGDPDLLEYSVDFIVEEALASAAQNTAVVPFPGTYTITLPTQTPYDQAFYQRIAWGQAPSGSRSADFVGMDRQPTYGGLGGGTWFGQSEAMKIVPDAAGSFFWVYTGDAEGKFQRFLLDPAVTTQAQPDRHFVFDSWSTDLGYGVYGLDVGGVTSSSASQEVAFSTFRKVHLWSAAYAPLASITFGDWEHFRPERLQIVDLDGDGRGEILCKTIGGYLVVLGYNGSQTLQVLAEYFEPGIIDLLAGPPGPLSGNGLFDKPIYVLSARKGLYALDLKVGGANLTAASVPLPGDPHDLEIVDWNGSSALAALFANSVEIQGLPNSIRIFDPQSLAVVSTLGVLDPDQEQSDDGGGYNFPQGGIDLAIGHDGGARRWLVLQSRFLLVYDDYGALLGQKDLHTYGPARLPLCVQCGNIDETPEEEIVISTEVGRLVWFTYQDLYGTNLQLPLVQDPGASYAPGYARSTPTLPAAWAMTWVEGEQRLHVVDQAGSQWSIDPASRAWSFVQNYPQRFGPIRDLVYVGSVVPGAPPTTWDVQPFSISVIKEIQTRGYDNSVPPVLRWIRRPYLSSCSIPFLLFEGSGDIAASSGSNRRFYCWSGMTDSDHSMNALIGGKIYEDPPGSQVYKIDTDWDSVGEVPPTSSVPFRGPQQLDLRSDFRDSSRVIDSYQSLRLGHLVSGHSEPDVVVSTGGGKVMLVQPDHSPIQPPPVGSLVESEDYGWGGMALALADLDGDGLDEVVFGTIAAPTAPGGQEMSGSIQVLDFIGSSFQRIDHKEVGFGICGLAIGEVDDQAGLELVVGTLEGDLIIYSLLGNGAIGPKILQRGYIGAVGAYNAIHIGDHLVRDPAGVNPPALGSDGLSEIYFATSSGVFRLDFWPQS